MPIFRGWKPGIPPKKIEISLEEHEKPYLGNLKVYAVHDFSSCGFYRCYLPTQYLKIMGMAQVRSSYDEQEEQGREEFCSPQFKQSSKWRDMQSKKVRDSIAWADVVVMERMGTDEGLGLMNLCHEIGKPVIHESDDMCEAVPPGNPSYWYWKEKERIRLHGECFKTADLTITTNPRLAAFYEKQYGTPAVVLENQVDYGAGRWNVDYTKGPGIIVGWMGSESHEIDIHLFEQIFPWLAKNHPEVSLEVVGYMPDWLHGIPKLTYGAGNINEVPRLMSKWDIGLCPISDHVFNTDGKSDIKWLEYSTAWVATVCSDLTPYRGSIENGSTGMLAKWDDPDDWIRKIERLIKSPLKRHTMVETSNELVRKTRSMAMNAHRWWKAYVALLCGKDVSRCCGPGGARIHEL